MKVTRLTVEVKHTISLGNYEFLNVGASITVEADEAEPTGRMELQRDLSALVEQTFEDQMDHIAKLKHEQLGRMLPRDRR